jgi:tetratricopeptide (TPR) repeat protein
VPTVGEAFEQARRLAAAGQLVEAEHVYRQLTVALPGAAEVWARMGIFFLEAHRPDAAVDALRKATQLDPANGPWHGALGAAHRQLKQRAEAVRCFRRALDIGPRSAALLNNLALALKDAEAYDEALATYDAALALQPEFQNGHFNRGNLLLAMRRLDEAIASFRRAIELNPRDADAHTSLGIAHYARRELDQAMTAYEAAWAAEPDSPTVRRNQALVWFMRGDYAKAWQTFEARLDCDDFPKRHFVQPRWDGGPLAGRTLCVFLEQGLGDALQFVRYLPLAAQAAGRVWYVPHEVLRPLLQQSELAQYLAPADELPDFDVQASLLSLPGFLPDRRGLPYWPGPYLRAEPQLAARWSERLSASGRLRVGIVWSGSRDHPADQVRSTGLANFASLAMIPGVRLISLQHGAGREQLDELAEPLNILDLDPEMDRQTGAFVDRAAVIENLDLVITVDTAVAHLAGALGKPVWVALQFMPDWRWGLDGETTPWYPSMRLFRQPALDDWQAVFERMTSELARFAAC